MSKASRYLDQFRQGDRAPIWNMTTDQIREYERLVGVGFTKFIWLLALAALLLFLVTR